VKSVLAWKLVPKLKNSSWVVSKSPPGRNIESNAVDMLPGDDVSFPRDGRIE
jgi:hypothetical protein